MIIDKLSRSNANSQSNLDSLFEKLKQQAPDKVEHLLTSLCDGLNPKLTEDAHYRAAEALSTAVYPTYKFSEYGRIFLEDESFLNDYKRFMDANNWHSLDRKYTLDQLLKLVSDVEGDMAECGTYKGASAHIICSFLRNSNRIVHLFDSFEGLSEPGKFDGDYWEAGRLNATEQTLKNTLTEFNNYQVYRGWIPEKFNEVSDLAFSFVHIDVDLYQPTLDALKFFYNRMNKNGLILMDDYGFNSCPGAKLAADEFFSDLPEKIILLTTGQAFVIKQ